MSEELKPCPFCGGPAKATLDGAAWPLVICNPCGAYMEAITTTDDPVPRWNRRASPTPPTTEGRGEDLLKRLKHFQRRMVAKTEEPELHELLGLAIAALSSPRVEEVRRKALEEAAARGMCRARILSNLIHDGRQEGQEWIQKAEDMGWEFYKWDASVAINRLEQDGYAFTKRSEASQPNPHGEYDERAEAEH